MIVPPHILAAIRQPAFAYRREGIIDAANDVAMDWAGGPLSGMTLADVIACLSVRRRDGTLVPPSDLPATRALRGEEIVDVPLRVTTADGRTAHVLATASPIREGETISGALSIWQDVTDRVEAEERAARSAADLAAQNEELQVQQEELRVQEEELRCQADELREAGDALRRSLERQAFGQRAARSGFWDWDMRTDRLAWSPEFYDLFGLDPAAPASFEAWLGVLHPQDRDGAMATIDRSVREGTRLENQYRVVLPGGAVRWIGAYGDTMCDSQGNPVRMAGICVDITDRKRAEEELHAALAAAREGEEILNALMDSVPEGITIADADLRVRAVSRFGQELLGGPHAEISTADVIRRWRTYDADGVTPLPDEESPLVRAIRSGEIVRDAEIVQVNEAGRALRLLCNAAPIRDDAGAVAGGVVAWQDVTERRRAEEALRTSEQRFRLALRNAPVSVAVMDRDLRFVWAYNQRTVRPEEVIGRTDAEVFTPDDAARLVAIKRRVLDEGVEIREQMWLDMPGGRVFVDCYFEPIRDEVGRVTGVGIATVDLTQVRVAEEALAASEARYRELFESMAEGFALHEIVLDEAGRPVDYRFLAVNPAFEEATGLDSAATLGRTAREAVPGLEPRWIERYGRVALTGEPERFTSYSAPLDRWYDVNAYSPAPGRFATVFRDVTTERRAVEGLRESEARLRDVLEVSLDAAYRRDLVADRYDYISPVISAITGYAADEFASLSSEEVMNLVHPDDRVEVGKAVETGMADGSGTIEYRLRHRNGTYRWLQDYFVVRMDADGCPIFRGGTIRDVTRRRRAEDALRRSNEELQRFAYVASHDLQEPLRSIISFSQLLERRYRGKLDQDADEFIGFIVDGGNRMQRLIQDLLQLSRVETQAKEPVPTDAARAARSAIALFNGQLGEIGGTVTVGPAPSVMADPAQLELVFANLIGNAIKYRRPEIPVEVSVSARRMGRLVEFAVEDNGIGIEPQYYDRIFEMFRRLHTHDKYEGTGIGLAVVKRIIERHGGTIRVESTPGEGSTFYFTLPAA